MAIKVISTSRVPVKAWVEGVPFADNAQEQLVNIASLPFIFKWVAAMPDVHLGKGATVGSVIPTKGAVIPAAVGVDLGCGMGAVCTSLLSGDLPKGLHQLRLDIEREIPRGFSAHKDPPDFVTQKWYDLEGTAQLKIKIPFVFKGDEINQLGTLGGGNHFLEVCLDEQDRVWIMLHSGSRGVGNRIGTHFIKSAKAFMEQWFIPLPDKDLAYLPQGTEDFDLYCEALDWALRYARTNRQIMMQRALLCLHLFCGKAVEPYIMGIDCHHNYMTQEHHYGEDVFITRKGAINAASGVMGIIPGSMGAKSFIVRGKGNPESFNSCSHGAGRAMSRNEAKRSVTMEQHLGSVSHVECRKDDGLLDESPFAYKPIDAVMEAQRDLVEVVHTLHQVLCIKG